MRAMKDRLPAPDGEVEESKGARSTRALEDRPNCPAKKRASESNLLFQDLATCALTSTTALR